MGYPVVLPVGQQRGHQEVEWKTYLNPRGTGRGIAGKNNHKRGFLQESCCFKLQWAVSQAEWKD